ncbi:ABC transporter permease [Timonella senegalensis]|jgi:peptide/nickel transport system permease protein|uniref:ABC transporter permease n=1 Tax=Timonella senegalensis TaxID=1465825 RepID=UPI0028A9784E|nr:ABC transporter permease [Timonella senegalensis]
MGRFIAVRVASLIVSLFVASVLIFAVLRLLPGGPAGSLLGVGTTAEQLEQLREELGMNQSLVAQYGDWIGGLFSGSTTSFVSGMPVNELIASKLPVTIPLSLAAFVVSVLVSVPLGVIAGVYRNSAIGVGVSALSQLGLAVPVFWVGVVLVWVFSLQAGILPSGGFPRQGWNDFGGAVSALVLPVITIAIAMSSIMVRYVRSATLDVLDADYIRTARSLGFSRGGALARHGLRNGAVPVVAILGIELATSLLGAVVVENVFALPGLGSELLSAVTSRDFPVIQNLVLFLTAVVLVMNFAVDLIQRAIDPRLRLVSASAGGGAL